MQRNRLLQSRCKTPPERLLLSVMALVVLAMSDSASAFQQQGSELPPDFKPPRQIPRYFQIEDEKTTDAAFDEWNKKERTAYHAALAGRSLDAEIDGKTVKKRIEDGVWMRVARFSLKSQRSELRDLRRELALQDVDLRAKVADVREFALQQIVKQATTLLTGNFHVRLHAVFLIGDLNLEPAKIGAGSKPAIAYSGGVPLLLSVLTETIDGKAVPQPEAIKVRAAHALWRILTESNLPKQPNEKTRLEIARVLLAEVEANPDPAYEWVLIHALADVGVPLVSAGAGPGKPEIVTALARVMTDPTRNLRNRCRAARLLGRTPIPGGVKLAPITWGIADLATQIGGQYATRIQPVHAIFYFQDLYYAYKAPPGESTSDGKTRAGLPEDDAYVVVKSVMAFFVKALMAAPVVPAGIPQAMLQQLVEVQKKKPADMSIWAGDAPIDQKKSKSSEERPAPPAG
ncbi:MAG: hypothetical protein O3C17_21625 [Planctomycetota bacterium]|nr:hypothetical protein [Planctomycetota bacterium]